MSKEIIIQNILDRLMEQQECIIADIHLEVIGKILEEELPEE